MHSNVESWNVDDVVLQRCKDFWSVGRVHELRDELSSDSACGAGHEDFDDCSARDFRV
jgi:hypothetical protein